MRPLVAVAAALALLGSSASAVANGRYPQAMQLAEDPTDPDRLWLMNTFGITTSPDRGKTWSWICEETLGMDPKNTFDPSFGVFENGTLMVGSLRGLKTSANGGCGWEEAIPELRTTYILDVSVEPRRRSHGIVLVSYGEIPDGSTKTVYTNQIWETTDNGRSFHVLADRFPENVFFTTLDAAPSDPDRLYLSVHENVRFDGGAYNQAGLMRSDDRGRTWTKLPLPQPVYGGAHIAAIHPQDPDVVYMRTLEEGTTSDALSVLYYTADGGRTWRELHREQAPMLGFALAADGSEVFIGFGDPNISDITVDAAKFGIWHASTTDFRFEKRFDEMVSCLSWSERGLYACSRTQYSNFDLALSTDGGRTFSTLQHRARISGPMKCPAGSGQANLCKDDDWQAICADQLLCEAPPTTASPKADEDSGCSCRTASGFTSEMGLVLLAFSGAIGAAALRRNRTRRR